MQLRYK